MARRPLLALALAGLAAFLWFALDRPATSTEPLTAAPGPIAPTAPAPEPSADLARATAAPAAESASVRRAALPDAPAAPAAHPWAERLAGVTGRIVEVDGTPIAGLRVELLQLEVALALEAASTPLGNPTPEIDETRTGPDGRFVLGGAHPSAFHALGLDRGGPRGTLRIIERALALDERTDLGDIVLAGFGTLFGKVVDEDGEPVGGARVRVAPVPDIVLETGVLDLRANSFVGGRPDGGAAAKPLLFALPALVGDQLDKLPIPTTTTASDGTFRLPGVPLARIVGGVDHPGYLAAPIAALDMQPGERDLGEIELTFGRTLTGRVLDRAGQPVAGAEVAGGALSPLAPVGVFQPAGLTDADGRFQLTGLPEVGDALGFARRTPNDEWIGAGANGVDHVELVLAGAHAVTVRVQSPDGKPVEGARFTLRAEDAAGMLGQMSSVLVMANSRTPKVAPRVEVVEPGVYALEALTHGAWQAEVEAQGFAATRANFMHQGAGTEVQITMAAGERLAVTVLAAATGLPVERAHVALIGPSTALLGALGSAWTGAEGRAELGPFTSLAQSERRGQLDEAIVRVLHPDFADECVTYVKGTTSLELRLKRPSELSGRVHWGGATPDRPYMVFLVRRGARGLAEAFAVPRLGLTDAEGRYRFKGLVAGDYQVNVAERYLKGDPLELFTLQQEPVQRYQGETEVPEGAAAVHDVDLSPSGLGPTLRLEGRVLVDGAPLAGATVEARGAERVTLTTDANGEFRSADISAVRGVWVQINGPIDGPGGRENTSLHERWIQASEGPLVRIDIDVRFADVVVVVREAGTGAPIAGAQINASWNEVARTDASGRATFRARAEQLEALQVTAAGYGTAPAQKSASNEGTYEATLARAVACSGRIVFDSPSAAGATEWAWLQIETESGEQKGGTQIDVGDGYTFEVEGLAPGRYRGTIHMSGQRGEPVDFELGPDGDRDLELRYRPRR